MREHLYLLGHPIAHSKSPDMYNAVYARYGLPWQYALADCATEEEAQAFLDKQAFLSINVTTPYKPLALEAATARAASAKLARGANLLVKKGSALIAYNTDGQGCVSCLERTGFSFAGKSIVVCGTGPTALAIMHSCAIAGAAGVTLVGRDGARAEEVLSAYVEEYGTLAAATIDLPPAQDHHRSFRKGYEETEFGSGTYAALAEVMSAADLVVNATPLGMKAGDPAPFDPQLLHEGQVVFDVVYGHGETVFVRAAREAGCTVHDGSGMLVAQAVATVFSVCDIEGVELEAKPDELYDIMSAAAGFSPA